VGTVVEGTNLLPANAELAWISFEDYEAVICNCFLLENFLDNHRVEETKKIVEGLCRYSAFNGMSL
jgi:hypothetical protein